MFPLTVNTHALAHGLRGFASTTLRVMVTRIDEASGNVWVRTADLLDAGTPLVLDIKQVESEEEAAWAADEALRHADGLVVFG
jgi:hypothetical protein